MNSFLIRIFMGANLLVFKIAIMEPLLNPFLCFLKNEPSVIIDFWNFEEC